jgi:hypothetical protein
MQLLEPIVRPFADDRIPLSERFLKFGMNYLGPGTKLQNIDAKAKYDDLIRSLQPQMRGITQTFPISYVPKEVRPLLSPEEELKVLLMNDLEMLSDEAKESRDMRKKLQELRRR